MLTPIEERNRTYSDGDGIALSAPNFRPTRESVLKFDCVRGRAYDEFNNRSDHAFLLFSIATYS